MENHASVDWSANQSIDNVSGQLNVYKIGIYGWRKRCLYVFILLLMVMVIVNLALTLWIVKVMDFSKDGMGKLRILDKGIRLEGEAEFLHALYANNIHSRKTRGLKIESARNLTLNARNKQGTVTTRLFVGDHKLESWAEKFVVKNTEGKILFAAEDKSVEVSAEMLKVTGSGGAVFHGSVQTPIVTADYRSDLRIESPTRSLDIDAPLGIQIESRAGEVFASCLTDLKLQSTSGSIRVDAERIYLDQLPEAPTAFHHHSGTNKDDVEVNQLCACDNGRLFLAPADGQCVADNSICK